MKILLIGNGFDIAHGLPTKYTDFLYFLEKINNASNFQWNLQTFIEQELDNPETWNKEKVNGYLVKFLYSIVQNSSLGEEAKKTRLNQLLESALTNESRDIISLTKDNFWFDHFVNADTLKGEGWIDFESEISEVIKKLDSLKKSVMEEVQGNDKRDFSSISLFIAPSPYDKKYFVVSKAFRNAGIDVKRSEFIDYFSKGRFILEAIPKVVDKLEIDLINLIRCLEIYLSEFVAETHVDAISPDIANIKFDKILSFNYTDSYNENYGSDNKSMDFDFIHGKAISFNTEENNMVLGIDEYLTSMDRDKDVSFIFFKKFFQRIYKETGCLYKDWLELIEEESKSYIYGDGLSYKHELYIFGHSLDVTDKDILEELIKHKDITSTIFYHDKSAYASQIKNLVKVLGQDFLISAVYGYDRRITFKQQKKFEPKQPSDLSKHECHTSELVTSGI